MRAGRCTQSINVAPFGAPRRFFHVLILTEENLKSLLTMPDVIAAVEQGFLALARGGARVPERLCLSLPDDRAKVLLMPAYAEELSTDDGNGLGAKIVSVFPANTSRGLDVVQAIYLLLDSETGVPLALMDGRFITAIRTAATSALATKLMATGGRKKLAVFGAGVQAEFHIEAMTVVADIERVMIASRGTARADLLASLVRARYGLACEVVSHATAASSGDLICTCTTASEPLFDGRLLKPGTHVNAVGAFTPATRELDTVTMLRSRVIVDADSAAGKEAGEILIPAAEGHTGFVRGALADVLTGAIPGRISANEITVFRSCGLAIEDLMTARLACELARMRGKNGVEVRL